MKLRTQILLSLFVFALAPLLVAIAVNVPLVLDRLQLFSQKAHLQNLRADFRDLDQHLASRQELARVLAKLPEPGALLGADEDKDKVPIDLARARYTEWINWIFQGQHDIIQILFLDRSGNEQFWLERKTGSAELVPGEELQDRPAPDFVAAGMQLNAGGVINSPISFNPASADPSRFMMLELISPLTRAVAPGTDEAIGAVVLSVDVGGLARRYTDTLWVLNDGTFLHTLGADEGNRLTAFDDFPGLSQIFQAGRTALWTGDDGRQVIWVPLFATEQHGPLWVGRGVDPSPIDEFRRTLLLRVSSIVVGLLIIVLLVARWVALRAERFGSNIKQGLGKVLNEDAAVEFSLGSAQELRALAGDLTRLAANHAHNSEALRTHAHALEESNKYKSEFLANVSHELRTPLNSILLLSKLLADNDERTLTEDQLRQIQVIHEAGRDLLSLIDQILDLSKIEAQMTSLVLQQVEIKGVMQDVIDLVSPLCADKALTLELKVEDDAPTVIVTDPDKLRQILKNFLSNAIKFTERGGITVGLSRNRGEDSVQRPVRISVTDTGVGIPPDKHGVIFEAFKQADGSTSRRYGGTGLGLSISRELGNLMGGRIELQSDEEQGATFSLLLPLELDTSRLDPELITVDHREPDTSRPDVQPSQSPASVAGDADAPEAFAGRRILVVDDDVRNLLALTPVLERWGFDVTAAGDGQEALETLASEPDFDVVLMDIMMPEMDGLEVIRQLRAQPRFAELPVIALTARAGEDDLRGCVTAGANSALPKPVETDQLLAAIREQLVVSA